MPGAPAHARSAPHDALVGQVIAERYRIDKLIGVGGMGAVFRAHHLGLEKDCAIKVLHPELTNHEEVSARFDREARSASRLDHPNCLQVTDFGTTESGMKYMVMQLLHGHELGDELTAPLTPERAVELMLQIVRGLEHAHDKGVVHRDLKPENVFVVRDHEGDELLKLVDFGIAKIVTGGGGSVATSMTRAGLVFGTPAYMSPEQATGMEVDARTDLYSAGVMLYQMLAGRPPFDAPDPVAMIRMQVGADPPPLPPTVPADLAGVVAGCLAKSRDERFPTATALREALERVVPLLAGIPAAVLLDDGTAPMAVAHSTIPALSADTALPAGAGGSGPARAAGVLNTQAPTSSFPAAASAAGGGSFTAQASAWIRRYPAWAAGGAALAIGLLAVAVWPRAADEPSTAVRVTAEGGVQPVGEAGEPGPGPGPASAAGPGGGAASPATSRVPADKLAEIDRLILAKQLDAAHAVIRPLLDEYPDDAQLEWREGQILAGDRTKLSAALARYGRAIDNDARILDDPDFYADLLDLLRERKLEGEALDLALRKMGSKGHTFLLELVNRSKRALSYVDRHRALDELATDPSNADRVDWLQNRKLDLWQAGQATAPCQVFREALERIEAEPDASYIPELEKVTVPVADPAAATADPTCDDLTTERDRVLEALRARYAAEPAAAETGAAGEPGAAADAEAGAAGEAKPASGAKPSGTSSKSSKSSKSGKNSARCQSFGGVFRKGCL